MTNLTARHVTPHHAASAPHVKERPVHARDDSGAGANGPSFIATLLAMLPATPVPSDPSPAKDGTSSPGTTAISATPTAGAAGLPSGTQPALAPGDSAAADASTGTDAAGPVAVPVASTPTDLPDLTTAAPAVDADATAPTAATTIAAIPTADAAVLAPAAAASDGSRAGLPVTGHEGTPAEPVDATPVAAGGADATSPAARMPAVPTAPAQVAVQPLVAEDAATAHPAGPVGPGTPAVLPADGARDRLPAVEVDTGSASAAPVLAVPLPVAPQTVAAPAPVAAPVPAAHLQILTAVSPLLQAPDGSYSLELQLRPHELGLVQVTVEMRGGELSIHLHAADAGAGDLLRDSLPDLRQQLEAQGMRTGGLDVGTGNPDRRNSPDARPSAPTSSPLTSDPVGATARDLDRSPAPAGAVDVRL